MRSYREMLLSDIERYEDGMNFVSAIYRALRLHNDLRAVRRGRIGKRLRNKAIGRMAGKLMR